MAGVWGEVKQDAQNIRNSEPVQASITFISNSMAFMTDFLSGSSSEEYEAPSIPSPDLAEPNNQSFSVHNIEITDSIEDVEEVVGELPARVIQNEYETEWHIYHQQYQNFFMVAYDDNDQVFGLYTNQDLLRSNEGISIEATKSEVRAVYGDPIDFIQKGNIRYQVNNDQEYDTFKLDNNYVTFFYDLHQNEQITAVQIISKEMEHRKQGFFGEKSDELVEGLAYQLFDLTNATRAKFELPLLDWHQPAQTTVRQHSLDMAENNYFSHTNLAGLSPFDRLARDDVSYKMAGENIATGQPSSVYAHHGLMNSEGHRQNILNSDFRLMTVGVAVRQDGQPFYTENYITQ